MGERKPASLFSDWNPEEARSVSLEEDWEVLYWTRHFHVSEDSLRRAVEVVGLSQLDIAHYLRINLCQAYEPPKARRKSADKPKARVTE